MARAARLASLAEPGWGDFAPTAIPPTDTRSSSQPPVSPSLSARFHKTYARSFQRAYIPPHPLASARSRRTVCGGRSEDGVSTPSTFGRPSPAGVNLHPGSVSSAPPLPAAWGKALRRHWPGRCARAGLKSRQPGNESARGSNPIAWRGSGLTFHAGLPRSGVRSLAGRSHRGPPSQNRATGRVRSPAEPLPPATSHQMLLTVLKSLATD